MKYSTKQLVFMALLTSISIILTRITSLRISFAGVEGIRIGLGDLPIIISGIIFGPASGGLVGAVSDIIGYFINPMGAYMPHFTAVKALTGIIPGIMIRFNAEGYKHPLYLGWIVFITQLITSVLLVPYFLQVLFGIPLKITILPRIMALGMYTVVFPFIIHILLNRFKLMGYSDITLTTK